MPLRATDLTGDGVYSDPDAGVDFELPETLVGSFTFVTPIAPTITDFGTAVEARYGMAGLELGIDGGLVADGQNASFADYEDPGSEDIFAVNAGKYSGSLSIGILARGLDEALDPAVDVPGADDLNAAGTRVLTLEYTKPFGFYGPFFSDYETVEFSATEFAAPVPLPPGVLLLALGLGAIGAAGARRRAG